MYEYETAAENAGSETVRARARIDLAALRSNVRALRDRAPGAALMAVVKADAYGHGMVPCARAARQAGAAWLGTATPHEALRAAGRRDRRAGAVLAVDAGRAVARGDRGGRRRLGQRDVGAARGGRRGPRGPPSGARPAQGRHRARPQRLPGRRLAGAGRRRARGRGATACSRSPACGRTSPAPTNPGHPSIAAQLADVPGRAGDRAGRRAAPRGAAHGQLPGHAHAARVALRPGTHRHRDVRDLPGAAGRPARPTSGCAR